MELIKENNIESEQTFSIEVSMQPLPVNVILPAIQVNGDSNDVHEGDFRFTGRSSTVLHLQFLPSTQVLHINLTIFDDPVAEGTEAFVLHSSIEDGSPRYYIPIKKFSDTRIIIEDDDSKF